MGKQNEANQLTRECILTALLRLMNEKPYEEITITDITRLAGVSRMAYYRNYSSKEEILTAGLEGYEQALIESLNDNPAESLRDVIAYLANFYAENARLMRAFSEAGLSERLFQMFCDRIYHYVPIVQSVSSGVYTVYYYAGAILSVLRGWVENDLPESAEEITKIICTLIGHEEAVDYIIIPEQP